MTLQTEVTEKPYVQLTDDEIGALLENAAPAPKAGVDPVKLAQLQASDAAAKKVQGLAP